MAAFTHNMNIAARCTQMQRSERLKDLGICGGQVPYLLRLCRCPGITQEELAQALYVNKSTAARAIAHLEKAGYVERRTLEEDRRCMALYPTVQAMEVIPRVREVIRDWNDYLLEELTPDERETLLTLMEKVSRRAQNYIRGVEGWDE